MSHRSKGRRNARQQTTKRHESRRTVARFTFRTTSYSVTWVLVEPGADSPVGSLGDKQRLRRLSGSPVRPLNAPLSQHWRQTHLSLLAAPWRVNRESEALVEKLPVYILLCCFREGMAGLLHSQRRGDVSCCCCCLGSLAEVSSANRRSTNATLRSNASPSDSADVLELGFCLVLLPIDLGRACFGELLPPSGQTG